MHHPIPSHPIPVISTQKAADANGLANGPNLPCDLDFRCAGAGDKPPVLCDGLDYVHTCTVTTVGMRPLGCNRHRALQHGVPCSKIARCCSMVCRVPRVHGVATWCAVLHDARHAVPALGCDRQRATPAAALWPHTVSILTVPNERTAAEWSRVHSTAAIERHS